MPEVPMHDHWELQFVDASFLQHTWIKWVANADEGLQAVAL